MASSSVCQMPVWEDSASAMMLIRCDLAEGERPVLAALFVVSSGLPLVVNLFLSQLRH